MKAVIAAGDRANQTLASHTSTLQSNKESVDTEIKTIRTKAWNDARAEALNP